MQRSHYANLGIILDMWYFSFQGGLDHVFREDSLRMGHGCHIRHTDLSVGGGGLCRRTLLQRPQTDDEERTVWGQASGHCLHARLHISATLHTEDKLTSVQIHNCACNCVPRNQNPGRSRTEWVRHSHPVTSAWRHPVWSSIKGHCNSCIFVLNITIFTD